MGKVEATNKIIVNLLKKKVENRRGNWVEQLPSVLWALRTTPNTATGETPFKLSHGFEVVLPIEFEVRSPGVVAAREGDEEWQMANEEEQRLSLDLVEELRDLAVVRQEEVKGRMAKYFDKHIRVEQFEKGDLVLKKVDALLGKHHLQAIDIFSNKDLVSFQRSHRLAYLWGELGVERRIGKKGRPALIRVSPDYLRLLRLKERARRPASEPRCKLYSE